LLTGFASACGAGILGMVETIHPQMAPLAHGFEVIVGAIFGNMIEVRGGQYDG
jgi:hypothetical protein